MNKAKSSREAKRSAASKRAGRKAPAAPAPAENSPEEDKLPELEEADAQDLQEVESELGISQWIDPDTGDPAEDSVPRLEDH
ncbi:MAG: hypothetical protein ACM30H_07970 [Clostridia bacterium]